jgi:hypothetical protein
MNTPNENEDLNLHVTLCTQRYQMLTDRLQKLEVSFGQLHNAVHKSERALTRVVIGTAGSVIASVLGLLIVVLIKL